MGKLYLLAMFSMMLAALLIFGCFGQQAEPYLVPDKADSYMTFKLSAILSDEDFLNSMREAGSTSFDESLKNATEELGFDPKVIAKATVFMKLDKGQLDKEYAALIAEGNIDKQKFIAKLKEKNDITEEQYEGVTVYKIKPKDSSASESLITNPVDTALAFVTDKQIVAGSTEAVHDCIDVKNGKKKALKDENLDKVSKAVDPDAMMLVVLKIPASWTNAVSQSSGGPYDTSSFGKATHLSFSYNKAGTGTALKASVLFKAANDAEKSKDVISGLLIMARGLTKSGSASEKLLKDVKINTNGEMLTMGLDATKETLKQLQEEMKKQYGTQSPDSSYGGGYN